MNSVIGSSDLLNISLSEIQKFCQETECNSNSNFSDGFFDGENNFQPIVYQWFNLDYRQGYLVGLAQRIGIEYALIHDVEKNRVIFV